LFSLHTEHVPDCALIVLYLVNANDEEFMVILSKTHLEHLQTLEVLYMVR